MGSIRMLTKSVVFNEKNFQKPVEPYEMHTSYEMDDSDDPADLIKKIGMGYRALVINCHGGPAEFNFGWGITSTNSHLFSRLSGHLEQIWFACCSVADGDDGRALCHRIADLSSAYVVASSKLQLPALVPKYHIRDFKTPVFIFTPNATEVNEFYWTQPDPRDHCDFPPYCRP